MKKLVNLLKSKVVLVLVALAVGASAYSIYKPGVTTDSLQACYGDPRVNLVAQAQFFGEMGMTPEQMKKEVLQDSSIAPEVKKQILEIVDFYIKNKTAKHGAAMEALVACVNGKPIK